MNDSLKVNLGLLNIIRKMLKSEENWSTVNKKDLVGAWEKQVRKESVVL